MEDPIAKKVREKVELCRKGFISREAITEILGRMRVEDIWRAFNLMSTAGDLGVATENNIILFECCLQHNIHGKEDLKKLLDFFLKSVIPVEHKETKELMKKMIEESPFYEEVLKDRGLNVDELDIIKR